MRRYGVILYHIGTGLGFTIKTILPHLPLRLVMSVSSTSVLAVVRLRCTPGYWWSHVGKRLYEDVMSSQTLSPTCPVILDV